MIRLLLIIILTGSSIAGSSQASLVREPSFGIEFEVPEGWQHQKTEMGYAMGSNTITGLMIIVPSPYVTLDEMKRGAYEGIQDENGTLLTLIGEPSLFEKNGLAGFYQGTMNWEPVKAYAIGRVSDKGGKGASCLIITTPDQFSDLHINELKKLARSINFFKLVIPDVVKEWENWFKTPGGSRLKYLSSSGNTDYSGGYSGSSSEATIDLCPNGTFGYNSNSDVSVNIDAGSAYSSSNDQGSGTWELGFNGNNTVLILNFRDGTQYEYELTYIDNKTYLNGTRYFVLFEGDGPQCY